MFLKALLAAGFYRCPSGNNAIENCVSFPSLTPTLIPSIINSFVPFCIFWLQLKISWAGLPALLPFQSSLTTMQEPPEAKQAVLDVQGGRTGGPTFDFPSILWGHSRVGTRPEAPHYQLLLCLTANPSETSSDSSTAMALPSRLQTRSNACFSAIQRVYIIVQGKTMSSHCDLALLTLQTGKFIFVSLLGRWCLAFISLRQVIESITMTA